MIEPANEIIDLTSKQSKNNIEKSFENFENDLCKNIKLRANNNLKSYLYNVCLSLSFSDLDELMNIAKKNIKPFEDKGYNFFIKLEIRDNKFYIKIHANWDFENTFKSAVNSNIISKNKPRKSQMKNYIIYATGYEKEDLNYDTIKRFIEI